MVLTGLATFGPSHELTPKVAPEIDRVSNALRTMSRTAPASLRSVVSQIYGLWSPVLAELLAGAQHPGTTPPRDFQSRITAAGNALYGGPGNRIASWATSHCAAGHSGAPATSARLPRSQTSPATSAHPPISAPGTPGAPNGLLTFVDNNGIEVADPVSGSVRLVVPIPSPALGSPSGGSPAGSYLVNGPVWGTAPGISHPVIYFVLHKLNSQGSSNDVFFRVDPFTGQLSVIASVPDATGSTTDLAALSTELLFTMGCCSDIGISALTLSGNRGTGPINVESPTNGMWFSLAATHDGLLAARHSVRGGESFLWVDPQTRSTSALQLPASQPPSSYVAAIALSADGQLEALSFASYGSTAGSSTTGSLEIYNLSSDAVTTPSPLLGAPTSLAFAPIGPWLAVASGGSVTVIAATGPNGAGAGVAGSPTGATNPYHLSTADTGAQTISWSPPIASAGFTDLVPAGASIGQLMSQYA